jgi:alkylation response protein AidB-like acyl-CoA dehydrogenase
MTTTAIDVLDDEMLARFDQRAPRYDRDNRFFDEDFDELRRSGYLLATVPRELGGGGLALDGYAQLVRRLAYVAPATALAVNMHCYWTGVAADLLESGDDSCRWILEKAAAGEVFNALHGEAGNDIPLLLAVATATRVDGGWTISGHKIFGSLSPVWTYGGFHALDATDPDNPRIVHGFLPRSATGYQIVETWDTLGMRATRSDDTLLDGAFVPDRYIARVLPAGTADLFVLSIFGWAEPTFASIYLGLAERARDVAAAGVKKRTSLALTRSMAYHPEVQRCFSEMQLALEAASAQVERVADDWSRQVDHGAQWPMKLVAAKHNAVEAAKKVVDLAMAVSGGTGMFRSNELERLYRDVRCGGFHPANTILAHEIVGKTVLGIDLGEQPRWG